MVKKFKEWLAAKLKLFAPTVWVCGRYLTDGTDGNDAWVVRGVFSTEQAAVAACPNWEYFIAPSKLDEVLPIEPEEWKGCYYPKDNW